MARDYNTPKHWKCSYGCERASVVETHLYVSGAEVIEKVLFSCGHTRHGSVGQVTPQSTYDRIENCLAKIDDAQRAWMQRKDVKVA